MSEITFSQAELTRYSRHFLLPEFGMEGQRKLKAAKVLVVGAGGLGAPLLQYLAAAGVGTLGIIDFDRVEESNLQRQVLFSEKDLGRLKVDAAKERLLGLNPHITINAFSRKLTSENAFEIIKYYDVVADGTDNFPTRYLVNDACILLSKTNVYASVFRFEGQVSVFNYKDKNGNFGPNYRDVFPSPPLPGSVPDCAEGGVLGILPGIIGSLQANEVIKVITGIGEPLSGKLFLFNALNNETQIIKIQKDKNQIQVIKLIDYENFCTSPTTPILMGRRDEVMKISPQEFFQMLNTKEDFQLIDVREKHEFDPALGGMNLGGKLIPLKELELHISEISRLKKVVIHCRSGKRSAEAIKLLQLKYEFSNLYNLAGGIIAYSEAFPQNALQR